jgi:arylsulfatase A-like enzyme
MNLESKDPLLDRREFIKLLGAALVTYGAATWAPLEEKQPGHDSGETPNVLILLFDTLSARHMSLYGYSRQTTPNTAEFARRSFVYHNHYAAGNFTSPATASLLTGVYPWSHKAINLDGSAAPQFKDRNLFSLCRDSHFTSAYTHNPLAGMFLNQFKDHIDQLHKMDTLSLTGEVYADKLFPSDFPAAYWSEIILRGSEQFFPSSVIFSKLEQQTHSSRLRQLEAELADNYPQGLPHNFKGMAFTLEKAIDWIAEKVKSLPQGFLAYYHLWPPHDPYLPRAEFIDLFEDGFTPPSKPESAFSMKVPPEELAESRQRYDEYITHVDAEFGRLLEMMAAGGTLEDTMVILTSDHGELFERGISGHLNSTLYQDLLRVPLLISMPGQNQRYDFYAPTSCVDVLPTISKVTGNSVPEDIDGRVLPGFNDREADGERPIYALEAKLSSKQNPFHKYTLAMVKGRYKLIRYRGYEAEMPDELYNLENDPEELENLALALSPVSKEMGDELAQKIGEVQAGK